MNILWAFWFKDKYRTPFSVYKMSLAELIVLGGAFFGVGFGVTLGVKKLVKFELGADAIEEPAVVAEEV